MCVCVLQFLHLSLFIVVIVVVQRFVCDHMENLELERSAKARDTHPSHRRRRHLCEEQLCLWFRSQSLLSHLCKCVTALIIYGERYRACIVCEVNCKLPMHYVQLQEHAFEWIPNRNELIKIWRNGAKGLISTYTEQNRTTCVNFNWINQCQCRFGWIANQKCSNRRLNIYKYPNWWTHLPIEWNGILCPVICSCFDSFNGMTL